MRDIIERYKLLKNDYGYSQKDATAMTLQEHNHHNGLLCSYESGNQDIIGVYFDTQLFIFETQTLYTQINS